MKQAVHSDVLVSDETSLKELMSVGAHSRKLMIQEKHLRKLLLEVTTQEKEIKKE
jgi:hypothetical protein